MEEKKILEILIKTSVCISAFNAEIQGMNAANQERLSNDETVLYGEDSYKDKANEIRGLMVKIT